MRSIDKYMGIPLTFIATLFQILINFFVKKKYLAPSRVLFVELSEMGSAILVDPAMRKIRDNKNTEDIYFVIFKKNKPSLQLLMTVKETNIFTINESNLVCLLLDFFKFILWCRKNKIDSVIDLELFSRFTALLSFVSFARHRVGFHSFHNEGLYRGDLLTKKVAYNPHIHIAKNFIALVDSLISQKNQVPFLKRVIKDDEIKIAKAKINKKSHTSVKSALKEVFPHYAEEVTKIILINSNASDLLPQRRWDRSNFATLIKLILKQKPQSLILLTGSPDERDGIDELALQVNHPNCINFAGCVKFLELPALYSLSSFMITNDSGPAHFASITNMHTFVIFGPETPILYSSLGPTTPIYKAMACSPCVNAYNHRKTPCVDNVCIQTITPAEIMQTIATELNAI